MVTRSFGERLELIMFKLDMTQTQFAQATTVPKTTLNNYINGRSIPSITNLVHIARYLGVSVDELIANTNLSTPQKTSSVEPLIDFSLNDIDNAIIEKHHN